MAAARALAGKARAGAASRPRVAAALRAPSLGADPPSLAAALQTPTRAARAALAPALLGSRAPPPLGTNGSLRVAALLGSRAPPPLGAGSPRAPALLGLRAPPPLGADGSPRVPALLDPRARPLWLGAGPRVPCLLRFPPTPLAALGVRRFSTGVGGEPDDKAGHVDGDKSREHTSKSKAVVDEAAAAAARATKSAPEINTAAVVRCAKPKDVSTGAASELPGNEHVLPGFNSARHVQEPRGNCLRADDVAPHDFSPSSDVEGAGGITGEVDVPAERSASSATRATKSAPKIHAAVVVRRATPKDVSTGAASELPGNDNVLPGCNNADHVDETRGNSLRADHIKDAVAPRAFSTSSNVDGAGGIPGEDKVSAESSTAVATRATNSITEILPDPKNPEEMPPAMAAGAVEVTAKSSGQADGNIKGHVDSENPEDAIKGAVDGRGSNNTGDAGKIPSDVDGGTGDVTKNKPEQDDEYGAGESKCRYCFRAFKAYSDQNRELTLSRVKEMLETNSEEHLKKQKVEDESSRTTQMLLFGFTNLVEIGVVAMVAVLYGVSYAVERVHDKVVVLSADEKTRTIVNNLMDMVRSYLDQISLVDEAMKRVKERSVVIIGKIGNSVRKFGNGIASGGGCIVGKIGNSIAAVGHGGLWIVEKLGTGAATVWDTIAVWKRLGKGKKVEEED